MPSPDSYWIISIPTPGEDPNQFSSGLNQKVSSKGFGKVKGCNLQNGGVQFKTATLSTLLSLSESLSKSDAQAISTLSKIVETIRNLATSQHSSGSNNSSNNDAIEQHLVMDDGNTPDGYLLEGDGWNWNRAKFRVEGKKLEDLADGLVKDISTIDNLQKSKLNSYNQAKGQLQQLQRKRTGNLSTRSLNDVVNPSDFQATKDSEYLETVLIAVNKNNSKEFLAKYERISQMVVPRSAQKLAEDDEFHLYSIVTFRKYRDEFLQKCRENKYIPRDFTFDQGLIERQKKEFEDLEKSERGLWAELLRISRLNFSECFELILHLKFLRTYIESVLRYGVGIEYCYFIVKPDPKQSSKLLPFLSSQLSPYLSESGSSGKKGGKGKKELTAGVGADEVGGEYASLMEMEWLEFVCFEVPKVERLAVVEGR